MNVSLARTPSPPPASAASAASTGPARAANSPSSAASTAARQPAGRDGDDRAAAFERALRERAAQLDEDTADDGSGGDAEHEHPNATPALAPARAEPPRSVPAPAAATATTAVDFAPEGTRAALQAALNANAPATPLAGPGEAAQAWQVSLNEPGAAIEVLATRLDRAGAETRSAWTLSIAAPVLPADVMARHVPQLTERLRVRGMDAAHVRIESRDTRERDGGEGGHGQSGGGQR